MMMENFTAPISLPSKIAKKKIKTEIESTTLPKPSFPVLVEIGADPEPQPFVPTVSTIPFLSQKPKDKESDLYNLSAKRVSTFPLKTISEISHQESLMGGSKIVEYKAPKECSCCAAKGFHEGSFGQCQGVDTNSSEQLNPVVVSLLTASKKVCSSCNGIGRAYEMKMMEVLIPKNVKTGTKELYRVDSQGRPLPLNALYGQEVMVEFIVKAHPQFAKDEDGNAFYNCKISPFQALLGATLHIPSLTLPGTIVDIPIPSGSQPGDVFRIPNQGYTKPNCKKKRGDLVCTIVVEIPEIAALTEEQKEFFHYLGKWKSFPRSATLIMKGSNP